jgi:hypothetical protein
MAPLVSPSAAASTILARSTCLTWDFTEVTVRINL